MQVKVVCILTPGQSPPLTMRRYFTSSQSQAGSKWQTGSTHQECPDRKKLSWQCLNVKKSWSCSHYLQINPLEKKMKYNYDCSFVIARNFPTIENTYYSMVIWQFSKVMWGLSKVGKVSGEKIKHIAKFIDHFVRQRTHNVCALGLDQLYIIVLCHTILFSLGLGRSQNPSLKVWTKNEH